MLLKPYITKILNNAKNERNNYLNYIKNIVNYKKDKIVLVDGGIHGTVLSSLIKITKKDFFGLYFVFSPVNKNKCFKKKKYGFYNFPNSNFYKNSHIFESVMMAPHGSFLYCSKNGKFIASKQKFSNQKKFSIKKEMHKGVLSFCKDFVSIYPNFTKLDVKNYFSDVMYGEYRNKIFEFSKLNKLTLYYLLLYI